MQGERVKRNGKFVLRKDGSKPDCKACPKQSPDRAHESELTHRNIKLLECYWSSKAGCRVSKSADNALNRNLGIVEKIIHDHDQQSAAQTMMSLFTSLFTNR